MAGDDFSPLSPLGDSLLDNPLCGDLMDDLREISQSLGDGSLGFDFPEYQSAEPEGSITLGEHCRARLYGSFVHDQQCGDVSRSCSSDTLTPDSSPPAGACAAAPASGESFPPLNLECRVCSDKASGFHYGVHACEGCKVRVGVDVNVCGSVPLRPQRHLTQSRVENFSNMQPDHVWRTWWPCLTCHLLPTWLRAGLNGLIAHTLCWPTHLCDLAIKKFVYFKGAFVAKVGRRCLRLGVLSVFGKNMIGNQGNWKHLPEVNDLLCIRVLKALNFKGCCSCQVMWTGRGLSAQAGGCFLLIRASVCYFCMTCLL